MFFLRPGGVSSEARSGRGKADRPSGAQRRRQGHGCARPPIEGTYEGTTEKAHLW